MSKVEYIPEDLYKLIVQSMPIPCIDLLVMNNGKYLITKRTQEPLKDEWYMPGSRLLKNETVQEACIRIAQKELNIKVNFKKVLCIYNAYYPVGYFGLDSHTFTLVCEATTANKLIFLDNSHSEYKWIDKSFKELHEYVKIAIKQARGENG